MRLPRNAQIWFPGYLASRLRRSQEPDRRGSGRVWISICDHYEPLWNAADEATGVERVRIWRQNWPQVAERHRDAAGHPAQYTFFFPQEEYRPFFLEPLAELTRLGLGDVEVHIHHDNEGEEDFLTRMRGFLKVLREGHGLLRERAGRVRFGFIHGNWALDNSLASGRRCGLNHELTLLRDLGCYADFTMPCAPIEAQARMVNQIYWVTDDPGPKSYDRGRPVTPGDPGSGDLLMIPGPLAVRWFERLVPRIEVGELASYNPVTAGRVRLWFDAAPRLGNDIFVKLFAHGTQERHSRFFFEGGELDRVFTLLAAEAKQRQWEWRWATAWQMFEAVERAAGGALLRGEGKG